jgi:hypothetical protein
VRFTSTYSIRHFAGNRALFSLHFLRVGSARFFRTGENDRFSPKSRQTGRHFGMSALCQEETYAPQQTRGCLLVLVLGLELLLLLDYGPPLLLGCGQIC